MPTDSVMRVLSQGLVASDTQAFLALRQSLPSVQAGGGSGNHSLAWAARGLRKAIHLLDVRDIARQHS